MHESRRADEERRTLGTYKLCRYKIVTFSLQSNWSTCLGIKKRNSLERDRRLFSGVTHCLRVPRAPANLVPGDSCNEFNLNPAHSRQSGPPPKAHFGYSVINFQGYQADLMKMVDGSGLDTCVRHRSACQVAPQRLGEDGRPEPCRSGADAWKDSRSSSSRYSRQLSDVPG